MFGNKLVLVLIGRNKRHTSKLVLYESAKIEPIRGESWKDPVHLNGVREEPNQTLQPLLGCHISCSVFGGYL